MLISYLTNLKRVNFLAIIYLKLASNGFVIIIRAKGKVETLRSSKACSKIFGNLAEGVDGRHTRLGGFPISSLMHGLFREIGVQ